MPARGPKGAGQAKRGRQPVLGGGGTEQGPVTGIRMEIAGSLYPITGGRCECDIHLPGWDKAKGRIWVWGFLFIPVGPIPDGERSGCGGGGYQ